MSQTLTLRNSGFKIVDKSCDIQDYARLSVSVVHVCDILIMFQVRSSMILRNKHTHVFVYLPLEAICCTYTSATEVADGVSVSPQ